MYHLCANVHIHVRLCMDAREQQRTARWVIKLHQSIGQKNKNLSWKSVLEDILKKIVKIFSVAIKAEEQSRTFYIQPV